MEGRRRVSRGSVERQTSQVQPIVGTPELVPEPSTVIFRSHCAVFELLLGLDEAEAQFGDGVIERALLLDREIAFGFLPAAWRGDRCCGAPVRNPASRARPVQLGLETQRVNQIDAGGRIGAFIVIRGRKSGRISSDVAAFIMS